MPPPRRANAQQRFVHLFQFNFMIFSPPLFNVIIIFYEFTPQFSVPKPFSYMFLLLFSGLWLVWWWLMVLGFHYSKSISIYIIRKIESGFWQWDCMILIYSPSSLLVCLFMDVVRVNILKLYVSSSYFFFYYLLYLKCVNLSSMFFHFFFARSQRNQTPI